MKPLTIIALVKPLTIIALVGVGVLIGLKFRGSESFCCGVVSQAARDKVSDKLGGTAGDVFGLLGLDKLVPGFLQTTGLRP